MNNNKLAEVIEDTRKILREHPLCDHCLGRIFAGKLQVLSHDRLGRKIRSKLKQKKPRSCYICKGLISELTVYLQKMLDVSKEYQFSTFLVGAILQPSIHDRDDALRSKFKLRGITSIKSDVTREIGKWFSRKTKTKVDYQNPDIVLTIDFKKDRCEIKPKAILLQARYTKNLRGLPQKQKPCDQCGGKGCFACEFHGISEFYSVEGKIVKFLIARYGAQQVKITWIGSEDESSLVMGNGRPFFAKLINPHKREVLLPKKIDLEGVLVRGFRTISKIPSDPIRFRTEVSLEIQAEEEIEPGKLTDLIKLKRHPITLFENSGHKNKKRIYDIKFKQLSDKLLKVEMKSDGGIPIRRFVSGQDVEPSFSGILQNNCKCKLFDFNKIIIKK